MMTNTEPKVGQVWNYQYEDPTSGETEPSFLIVITRYEKDKWVQFKYLDNRDNDEMSYSIFHQYCELVSG
jgi:hypothetical protein